jgi:hypothetical protein
VYLASSAAITLPIPFSAKNTNPIAGFTKIISAFPSFHRNKVTKDI